MILHQAAPTQGDTLATYRRLRQQHGITVFYRTGWHVAADARISQPASPRHRRFADTDVNVVKKRVVLEIRETPQRRLVQERR